MTARKAGALIDDAKRWHSIDWKAAQRNVRRLQMRIAKAVTEGKPGKVKATAAKGEHAFSVKHKEKKKKTRPRIYQVIKLSKIGIKRYVKVRAHANPYLKEFGGYFYKHRHDKKARIALTWGDVNNRDTQGTFLPILLGNVDSP